MCGINSTPVQLEKGQNENCRVYGVQNNKYVLTRLGRTSLNSAPDFRLTLVGTRGTLTVSADDDDYQVSSFS